MCDLQNYLAGFRAGSAALNPAAAVRTRVVSGANGVSRDAALETSGERV
jgi:hypothetical protein